MKIQEFKDAVAALKTGDKVICSINGKEIEDAKILIREKDYQICYNEGTPRDFDTLGYNGSYWVEYDYTDFVDYIKPLKDLYNLKVGDIIVDRDGDEQMVLGVHEGENPLYHLSEEDELEKYGEDGTAKELEYREYEVKQEEDKKEEIEEITMEQLWKEFRPVKIIKN